MPAKIGVVRCNVNFVIAYVQTLTTSMVWTQVNCISAGESRQNWREVFIHTCSVRSIRAQSYAPGVVYAKFKLPHSRSRLLLQDVTKFSSIPRYGSYCPRLVGFLN